MDQALSVSDATRAIKALLEEGFPWITIRGEVSNFKPASSGHWYFNLKDQDSMIACVMFKGKAMNTGLDPRDGMEVTITGSVTVYEKRGSYQIIADSMELQGAGSLLQKIEALKQRLSQEGLFDGIHKKSLPLFTKKVVVVTSPTGAALRDILQVLGRRAPWMDVCIVPVPVQGEGAGEKIARAIDLADKHRLGDVMIVGRGGGSTEDLLAFSDEVVVRAIARAKLPIVSAVGHEIDFALSDFAADVRAPTPSAAAELVAASGVELQRRYKSAMSSIIGTMVQRRREAQRAMVMFSQASMERTIQQILQPYYQRCDDAKELLLLSLERCVERNKARLLGLRRELEACSPWDVLKRGYAILQDSTNGVTIDRASQVSQGMVLTVTMQDGSFQATKE